MYVYPLLYDAKEEFVMIITYRYNLINKCFLPFFPSIVHQLLFQTECS